MDDALLFPRPRTDDLELARGTAQVAGLSLAAKGFGMAEKLVLSFAFGTSAQADAFLLVTSAVTGLAAAVRQLVEPVLLPAIALSRHRYDEHRALSQVRAVFSIIVWPVAIATLTLVFAPATAVSILAAGSNSETRLLAIELARPAGLAFLMLGITAVSQTLLNANKRFVAAGLGDLVLKAIPVAACVGAAFSRAPVLFLGAGLVAGALARAVVHATHLRVQLRAMPSVESAQDTKNLILLTLPLALGAAIGQLDDLADNFFASGLQEGALSARIYARKIAEFPVVLLPQAFGLVLFANIAALAARGEMSAMFHALNRGLRVMTILFVPLSLVLYAFADPLVALTLEHGAFGASARHLTAAALRIYALGLAPLAAEALIVPVFYTLRDTRTPVVAGGVRVLFNVALCALLVRPFGLIGIALSLVISKTAKVIVLALLLHYRGRENVLVS